MEVGMRYEYKCKTCDFRVYSNERGDTFVSTVPCYCPPLPDSPDLPYLYVRVFSFSVAIPFKEHFNSSAGQHISSRTQHADILKRASEIETAKSGVEHKYVPVDPADAKAVYGIKDDMLESVREDKAKSDLSLGKSISDVQKTKTFVI